MTLDTIVRAVASEPPGLGGLDASLLPAPVADTRLHYLFRTSLKTGRVHPLWPVMLSRRRDQAPVAGARPAPPPNPNVAAIGKLQPDEVRRRVAELPPLPKAALRALQTLRREDASLEEVAVDLACDASLTARVLRLANSPFYGVPGRVSSVRDAAQVLGRRTLESMLTLAAVAGQFEARCNPAFDAAAFWRHALASAIAARGLARAAGLDEDQAFVAALLHDIGLLAMSAYFPEALNALILQARVDDAELCVVEGQHGLTTHADVGAWIATHWNFPIPVVQAIAAHHRPAAASPVAGKLAACVHVANAIAHALDVAKLAHELVPAVDPAAWQQVALTDEALCSLLDDTETGVKALCTALAL